MGRQWQMWCRLDAGLFDEYQRLVERSAGLNLQQGGDRYGVASMQPSLTKATHRSSTTFAIPDTLDLLDQQKAWRQSGSQRKTPSRDRTPDRHHSISRHSPPRLPPNHCTTHILSQHDGMRHARDMHRTLSAIDARSECVVSGSIQWVECGQSVT
jgi:hypothetical protein